MPRIRLLTSVQGDGPVHGDVGDEIEVDAATARVWADGERAERVLDRQEPIERTVRRSRGGRDGSD
jgi:hypothetical protein